MFWCFIGHAACATQHRLSAAISESKHVPSAFSAFGVVVAAAICSNCR